MSQVPFWHACAQCGIRGTTRTWCRSCANSLPSKRKPRKPCPPHDRTRRDTYLLERQGKIARPDVCQRCGARPTGRLGDRIRIEVHHTDYADPWAVEFVCSPCHRIADAEMRRGTVGEFA